MDFHELYLGTDFGLLCEPRPLESPVSIIKCIADALPDFFHRVKLVAAGFLSRPGFPQSTKLGL